MHVEKSGAIERLSVRHFAVIGNYSLAIELGGTRFIGCIGWE